MVLSPGFTTRNPSTNEGHHQMKNSDVELCLISAIVISGDMSTALKKGISVELFRTSDEEWSWIADFYLKKGKCPSETAFENRFPGVELLDTDEVEHWSEQLVSEYRRRSLVRSMRDAIKMVDEGDPPEEAAGQILQSWREATIASQGADDDTEIIQAWKSAYDEAIERKKHVLDTGFAGIPTGITTLDEATGGMQPSWFVIVAGRLGAGKSMLMMRMAWEAVWQGKRVCYLSLEQSTNQVAYRIHSFASNTLSGGKDSIDSMNLIRGKGFKSARYKDLLTGIASQTEGKLWVNDTSRGNITPSILASIIADKQPDIVFVDYLTLMGTDGAHKEHWQKTSTISGELKLLAGQFEIPIVAGSQLNRGGVGDPGNEHLSGSDAVGQDADLVVIVTSKSETLKKLKVSKFRHGPDGQMIYCSYQPAVGVFDEVTARAAERIIEDDAMSD